MLDETLALRRRIHDLEQELGSLQHDVLCVIAPFATYAEVQREMLGDNVKNGPWQVINWRGREARYGAEDFRCVLNLRERMLERMPTKATGEN